MPNSSGSVGCSGTQDQADQPCVAALAFSDQRVYSSYPRGDTQDGVAAGTHGIIHRFRRETTDGEGIVMVLDKAASDQHEVSCCIIGAGPAGLVLGYLLAHAGCSVLVVEAGVDFDRKYRGDMVHPATLELLDQLGLADRLLEQEHARATKVRFVTRHGTATVADFDRLRTRFPYLAMMPQSRFLDFLLEEARQLDGFDIMFRTSLDDLLVDDEKVTGVRLKHEGARVEVRSQLVVGADGRYSKTRRLAGLTAKPLSEPRELFWFSLPKVAQDPRLESVDLFVGKGAYLALLARSTHWQVGYGAPGRSLNELRAAGLEPIFDLVRDHIPWLQDRLPLLTAWNDLTRLVVQIARVEQWHKPGLLLIGDAAHVMSPNGGFGINLAIQDAVATANIVTKPLRSRNLKPSHLAAVQKRRQWQTDRLQRQQLKTDQRFAQKLSSGDYHPPRIFEILARIPILRDLPARIVAFGLRRERLRGRL